MKLGRRQQARRITPPPVQEAMPPPREPMASFPTGPYDMPPPGYGPDGSPTMGYGSDGMPWMGPGPSGPPAGAYGPDGMPTGIYGPDGFPTGAYGPDGMPAPYGPAAPPWMPNGQDGFPPMAYAYAPDGTPLLYGTDGPPPGYATDGPAPAYVPDGPPMGYPEPPAAYAPGLPPPAAYAPEPPPAAYAPEPPPPAAYAPEPAPAAHAPEPLVVVPIVPEPPQVTWEPEPVVATTPDDAPPWPDYAPINRANTDDGGDAGVERLPTATQAHRLQLERPSEHATLSRTAEARLARLRLRGGMLDLARASLEQLAGAGTLDREALADLAETRWRSGDLEGAAEAAEAHLQARGDEPIPRIIAAEQAAYDGRILDARQLATQVLGQVGDGLERLFAGEPRSAVWPPAAPGWMDAGAVLGGRFGLLVGGEEVSDPHADTWVGVPMTDGDDPRIPAAASMLVHTAQHATPLTVTPQDVAEAGREADRELQAAERDLARGDLVALADRLGLLLRRDPALAPVILSLVEHALSVVHDPTAPGVASMQMLRGDVLRGQGHETDATQAYQQALHALPGRALTREST